MTDQQLVELEDPFTDEDYTRLMDEYKKKLVRFLKGHDVPEISELMTLVRCVYILSDELVAWAEGGVGQ